MNTEILWSVSKLTCKNVDALSKCFKLPTPQALEEFETLFIILPLQIPTLSTDRRKLHCRCKNASPNVSKYKYLLLSLLPWAFLFRWWGIVLFIWRKSHLTENCLYCVPFTLQALACRAHQGMLWFCFIDKYFSSATKHFFFVWTGNHSCEPNAEVTFPYNNSTLALKALSSIQPGEVHVLELQFIS